MGSLVAALASIGFTGGSTGRSMPVSQAARLPLRSGPCLHRRCGRRAHDPAAALRVHRRDRRLRRGARLRRDLPADPARPYLALRREGIELHYFGMDGFRPEDSYGTCVVIAPDPEAALRRLRRRAPVPVRTAAPGRLPPDHPPAAPEERRRVHRVQPGRPGRQLDPRDRGEGGRRRAPGRARGTAGPRPRGRRRAR